MTDQIETPSSTLKLKETLFEALEEADRIGLQIVAIHIDQALNAMVRDREGRDNTATKR